MKLENVRKQIDLIDEKILSNVAERMRLAKKVKQLKVRLGIPIYDKKREQDMLKALLGRRERLGLSNSFVKRLLNLIISESKKVQKKL